MSVDGRGANSRTNSIPLYGMGIFLSMFRVNKLMNSLKKVSNKTAVATSSSSHSISLTPSTKDGSAHVYIRSNKLGVNSMRNKESRVGRTPKSAWTDDSWLVVPLFPSIFLTRRYPE